MSTNKDKAAETLTSTARGLEALANSKIPTRFKLVAFALAIAAAIAALMLSGCAGSLTYKGVKYTFGAAPDAPGAPAATPAPRAPHGCTAPGAKCPPPGAILGE